ncbi:hypothetical protein [Aquamicrobium zhengzhouense]|uniref:Uncharacterized protein n=1 Tax=Aquamicrobium zhengzhouense TaxID=2781738 RepID=A0ABS0SEX1_9HYPH|nr:hypothetical protein [Aquamicrobium zhengzhouense]MBI1620993.1 hypothetical protein [Aquamicrobium zhengzhouense]
MSSPQQHLSSDDMSMIMRVHAAVCDETGLMQKGAEGLHLASLLVHEFQRGVTSEDELKRIIMARRTLMATDTFGT